MIRSTWVQLCGTSPSTRCHWDHVDIHWQLLLLLLLSLQKFPPIMLLWTPMGSKLSLFTSHQPWTSIRPTHQPTNDKLKIQNNGGGCNGNSVAWHFLDVFYVFPSVPGHLPSIAGPLHQSKIIFHQSQVIFHCSQVYPNVIVEFLLYEFLTISFS